MTAKQFDEFLATYKPGNTSSENALIKMIDRSDDEIVSVIFEKLFNNGILSENENVLHAIQKKLGGEAQHNEPVAQSDAGPGSAERWPDKTKAESDPEREEPVAQSDTEDPYESKAENYTIQPSHSIMQIFGDIKTFRMHKTNTGVKFEIAGYMKSVDTDKALMKNLLLDAMQHLRGQSVILTFEAMPNKMNEMTTVKIQNTSSLLSTTVTVSRNHPLSPNAVFTSTPEVLCNISNKLYDKLTDMTGSDQSYPMIDINVEKASTTDRGPPTNTAEEAVTEIHNYFKEEQEQETDDLEKEDGKSSKKDKKPVRRREKLPSAGPARAAGADSDNIVDNFEYECELYLDFAGNNQIRQNKPQAVNVECKSYSLHFNSDMEFTNIIEELLHDLSHRNQKYKLKLANKIVSYSKASDVLRRNAILRRKISPDNVSVFKQNLMEIGVLDLDEDIFKTDTLFGKVISETEKHIDIICDKYRQHVIASQKELKEANK